LNSFPRHLRATSTSGGPPTRQIASSDIGRGRDTLRRDPALHVQKRGSTTFHLSLQLAFPPAFPMRPADATSHRAIRHWTGRVTLPRDPALHVQKSVEVRYLTCPVTCPYS
jgi:hypothetical protein